MGIGVGGGSLIFFFSVENMILVNLYLYDIKRNVMSLLSSPFNLISDLPPFFVLLVKNFWGWHSNPPFQILSSTEHAMQ